MREAQTQPQKPSKWDRPAKHFFKRLHAIFRDLGERKHDGTSPRKADCARVRFDRAGGACSAVRVLGLSSSPVRIHATSWYPLILLVPHQPQLLIPFLVVIGIGYGGLLPSIPILTVEFFGRAHLGTLLGVYKIPYDVAAASAPLLTAYLYDLTGGYTVPERINVGCGLMGFAIALGFVRRPAR